MKAGSAREEFYVGWRGAPPGLARWWRRRVAALLPVAALLGAGLALAHRPVPRASFEYGTTRAFQGVVELEPCPLLRVRRPGLADGAEGESRYLLVDPGKHGAAATLAPFAGREVRLEGTLAHRGGRTLVELVPGSVREVPGATPRAPAAPERLGEVRLAGEIVDSKCWLGVMRPGELAPHRPCAVRCLSGGIPAALCVRERSGRAAYVLLVDGEGRGVGERVLDLVAEPVEIRGALERWGDLLVLRSDPSTYVRIP